MPNSPLIVNGELLLYGFVGMHFPEWGIDGFTDRMVVEALSELEGDITVRVNSGGGFAVQGVAIYQALRLYDGKVTVRIDGIAASAASVFTMAGDTVVMPVGTMMMIHDGSGVTWGTAVDHEKTAQILHFTDARMAEIYAKKTGMGVQEIRQLMDDETWLSGDEAREQGFADEVTDDEAAEVTAFDYRLYRNAPAELQALAAVNNWALPGPPPAAIAAHAKEPTMTTKPGAANNPAATTEPPANPQSQAQTTAAAQPAPPAAAPAPVAQTAAAPEDAVKAAKERINAILNHDAAKGRDAQARALALETDLSVEQAVAILETAPQAEASGQSYEDRKAGQGPLGLDLGAPGTAAQQPKAQINPANIYAQRRKAMGA